MRISKLLLCVLASFSVLVLDSCGKDGPEQVINGPVKDDGEKEDDDSGDKTLKDSPYLIGCTVNPSDLRNKAEYRDLVISEFSSLTAENAMKMRNIWTGRDSYYWDDADFLVNFAENNGMRVHGHTLIWYKNPPEWLKQYDGQGEDVWKELMKEYITEVVGRYKGRIASWDVVNEAVNYDGIGFRGDKDIWYKNLGEEYIALAFQYAHEADPDALLFYNDYGMEWGPTKRGKICELISGLKEKGVPVHGIGLQMHTDINRSTADIRKAIEDAHACGVMVHVSEMDVNLYPEVEFDDNGNAEIPEGVVIDGNDQERLAKQKAVFKAVAEALSDLPAADVFGLTTWGVTDNSAYQLYYPLLFDKDYQKKPAYYGITETF